MVVSLFSSRRCADTESNRRCSSAVINWNPIAIALSARQSPKTNPFMGLDDKLGASVSLLYGETKIYPDGGNRTHSTATASQTTRNNTGYVSSCESLRRCAT